MCMSTVSVTASVLVISLHFRNAKTYTMPVWVSSILQRLAVPWSSDEDDPCVFSIWVWSCRFKSTFVTIWPGCWEWRVRVTIWLGIRFVVNGRPRRRHTIPNIDQPLPRLRIMWASWTSNRFSSQWIFPSTVLNRDRLEPSVHRPSVHLHSPIRISCHAVTHLLSMRNSAPSCPNCLWSPTTSNNKKSTRTNHKIGNLSQWWSIVYVWYSLLFPWLFSPVSLCSRPRVSSPIAESPSSTDLYQTQIDQRREWNQSQGCTTWDGMYKLVWLFLFVFSHKNTKKKQNNYLNDTAQLVGADCRSFSSWTPLSRPSKRRSSAAGGCISPASRSPAIISVS